MTAICNDDISKHELLGRILNETSQINKRGEVGAQALYPRPKADTEPGRENMFSNKLSVVRLCRGHHDGLFNWNVHKNIAESFIVRTHNVFRGFLIAKASTVRSYGLEIVPDGHERNPNHAHIIIPDFNVEYSDGLIGADVIPSEIRESLDRLRKNMKTVILNPGSKYPSTLNYASSTDSICSHCPTA